MSSEAHSVPLTIVEGSGTVGFNDSWSRAHIKYEPWQPAMKLHPQKVSHYTVDLVQENAAGVVGMELDCGLVNKTTKEHVPAKCSQAPTVEGGAHISDWDLRLGTRWCKV